jgi:hypothetical protein
VINISGFNTVRLRSDCHVAAQSWGSARALTPWVHGRGGDTYYVHDEVPIPVGDDSYDKDYRFGKFVDVCKKIDMSNYLARLGFGARNLPSACQLRGFVRHFVSHSHKFQPFARREGLNWCDVQNCLGYVS